MPACSSRQGNKHQLIFRIKIRRVFSFWVAVFVGANSTHLNFFNYTVDLTKQNFALIFQKWHAVEASRGIDY